MTVGQFFEQYKVQLLLVFLLLGSWFLADIFDKKHTQEFIAADHSADYFSVGYYKKEMNQQGIAKNELIAEKLIHYIDDGTIHLQKPVMTLHNADTPPWVIKSESGILAADRENLMLSGKVFINRRGTKKQKPFDINTSELKVKLSRNYAETDNWAELIEGSSRTEGVGMNAIFVEPVQINFLSKVKGRYEFN
jgi:lipopolysaccharide export system protein LptC